MSTSISVLFYARKSKPNSRGEAPIYMRITVNGERLEFGTKRFVLPELWSADTGRMKGTNSQAKSMNNFLETLLSKAYSHQRQILLEGKEITMKEFKSRWRHTFATTVTLSNGVPIETVGRMLGHKNLKTTQHYARILDLKVSTDMKVLRSKYIKSAKSSKNSQ